jgi:hypothetical protein
MAVFWVAAPCSLVELALIMEAVSTSETSVNFYQPNRCNNPEDTYLHVSFMFAQQLLVLKHADRATDYFSQPYKTGVSRILILQYRLYGT